MKVLLISTYYCRFQVIFQHAGSKFVANLPIMFPSLKIGRELRKKFASTFQWLNFVCKHMFILNNNNQFNEILTFLIDQERSIELLIST